MESQTSLGLEDRVIFANESVLPIDIACAERVPVILESTVAETEVESEIERARLALPLASANGTRSREARRFQSAVI